MTPGVEIISYENRRRFDEIDIANRPDLNTMAAYHQSQVMVSMDDDGEEFEVFLRLDFDSVCGDTTNPNVDSISLRFSVASWAAFKSYVEAKIR